MMESIRRFGTGGHLTGMWVPALGESTAVAVLLLNAGVISRAGPHRFNVKLSRMLAKKGIPSLRFDLSGQGDSEVAATPLPSRLQARADVIAAMDHLSVSEGIERFVVFGICSGANVGWDVAAIDSRMIGLYMIDPYVYRTRLTSLMYHVHRTRYRSIAETLAAAASAFKNRRRVQRSGEDDSQEIGSRERYAETMQHLVDRGVSIHIVYTSTWSRYYSYRGQFRDVFGTFAFHSHIVVELIREFDHTLTLLSAQRAMLQRVGDWIDSLQSRLQSELGLPMASPQSQGVEVGVERADRTQAEDSLPVIGAAIPSEMSSQSSAN